MELDKLLKEAHELSSKPANSNMDNDTKNGSDELKTAPRDFNGYYLTSNNQYLYVEIDGKRYLYQLGQEKSLIDYLIHYQLLSVGLTIQLSHYYMNKQYIKGIKLLSPKVY